MVSKKKLNHGYKPTFTPKAPRSIRKRGPRKDLVKDSELCAFDLLAAVAGKLLRESESSASSNVAEADAKLDENKKPQFVDDKPTKSDSLDHGSCAESAFIPEASILEHKIEEQLQTENNSTPEQTSTVSSSEVVKKVDCIIKLETGEVKGALENPESFNCKQERGEEMHSDDVKNRLANTLTVKDPTEECVNTNKVINSEDSVHLPLYSDSVPAAALQKHLNNVGTRDDDEKSSGCDKSSTKSALFKPQLRKMLTYKHRKADSMLKHRDLCHSGERMKSFSECRKRNYTVGRCQQAHIKKRKLSDHSSAIVHDQDTSSESISNFPKNGMTLATAIGSSAAVIGRGEVKDHHVKFSIKSFKVPELCIEVPENASVGSLKRAVMQTVTAIFGSGFQVGIVLQGKMVRDNNKTLLEAGISDGSNLDTLGFMLEPCFTNVSSSITAKNLPLLLPQDSDQELPSSPAATMVDPGISNTQIDLPLISKYNNNVDNNEKTDVVVSDSKALVPVSPMNAESLAVVPVNQKPKPNEHSHRRTRRPFTVAEVEALVSSVEKLGTGRWRDVKIGAFEHADHRTYVDLKDKWKTLVHTASISPQQRRGEPVPQELLDRVLAAHSYWSKQQGKLHLVEPLKMVDGPYGLEGSVKIKDSSGVTAKA